MRRSHPLPAAFAGFVLTVFAATPNRAAAAAPDRPAVELVRAGDREMSCQALAAEINTLAQAEQQGGQPRRRKGGFLRALGKAAPFLGPVGMIGGGMAGMVASQAAGAAGSLGDRNQTDGVQDAAARAMAGPSVEAQRKERLTTIFEQKGC